MQIKCKECKNKVLKDMAIEAITEEMAKYILGIGQDDIKKKINTLKTPSFFIFLLIWYLSRCSNASKALRSIAAHSPSLDMVGSLYHVSLP